MLVFLSNLWLDTLCRNCSTWVVTQGSLKIKTQNFVSIFLVKFRNESWHTIVYATHCVAIVAHGCFFNIRCTFALLPMNELFNVYCSAYWIILLSRAIIGWRWQIKMKQKYNSGPTVQIQNYNTVSPLVCINNSKNHRTLPLTRKNRPTQFVLYAWWH